MMVEARAAIFPDQLSVSPPKCCTLSHNADRGDFVDAARALHGEQVEQVGLAGTRARRRRVKQSY
jgi:hypothetical protein